MITGINRFEISDLNPYIMTHPPGEQLSEKSFKRSIKSLHEVFDFLMVFFEQNKIGETIAFNVKFAVEELFTNLVKYNSAGPTDITISLALDNEKLTVSIVDFELHPFDPTKTAELKLDGVLEQRRPGGLGIHLVKRMMDKFEYEHTEKQSTIRLVQFLEKRNV